MAVSKAKTLFSPPYVDREGSYGRDFYRETLGFGRVRKLEVLKPVVEVKFVDADLSTAYLHQDSHVDAVDNITDPVSAEDLARAGNLASQLIKYGSRINGGS